MSYNAYKQMVVWITCLIVIICTKKPNTERQLAVWRLECELGVIPDPECPVDGGWMTWSSWSHCKGSCDDVGRRQRTRECNNPPPSQDGMPCNGPDEQIEICYVYNCTVEDYRSLIIGDPARVEAFHELEAVPALMEHCLQMECPFEAIEAALASDNTWQLNAESLWNSLQCVKRNLGCLIPGEWGAWGTWSACGARCGRGFRWRLRRCDMPPPSDTHITCPGTPLQAEDCVGDQCAISGREYGGTWGEWSTWSECSEKCSAGVKRRKRVCLENHTQHASGTWGTHCRGQHDQLEVCENNVCIQEGGWSGWGAWGPCSQTCGAGRRSRPRSCTRPIPSGGSPCIGPRTEVGSCHIVPCVALSHTVTVLNGESYLHYNFLNKRSTLFHFYMKFIPLSPHGTLVRRGTLQGSHVRLSLQKWHICLDVCGLKRSCCISRSCSHQMTQQGVWHNVLITVTSEAATLRLDNAPITLKSLFPCDPELPDSKMDVFIGERLHGEIQELIMNFIPLSLVINRDRKTVRSDFYPTAVSNIAYKKADIEEAYLHFKDEDYLRLPCFINQDEWRIELTIKPKKEVGTIIFLTDGTSTNWLHIMLQNMRLKMKVGLGEYRSESSSSTEIAPDQWLDIIIIKKQDTNAIETSINAGERLHILYEDEMLRIPRKPLDSSKSNYFLTNRFNHSIAFCTDEFFIGGVPHWILDHFNDEFIYFSGIVALITLNRVLLDLQDYSLERYKNGKVQVSSRAASISDSYHEIAWGQSNRLNLTCLHARINRSPHAASWLFLDVAVSEALSEKPVRSIDDGRVLRLVATADNDLRGFYTCRAHNNKRTRNIITYGVLGKYQHKLTGPDTTTAIAVVTTFTLVLGTLAWLIIEGIHDIRDGFGFFRDAHMSPQEEAEVVCKFIDNNIKLIGSKSAAKVAKARARERGHHLESHGSFGAQEPQGMLQQNLEMSNLDEDERILPVLPDIKSSGADSRHKVYAQEPCYISSPRHGSITSPKGKLTSSSSVELTSPRVLCSRLLLAKRLRSSREKSLILKKVPGTFNSTHKAIANLLTIKSSSYTSVTCSPAQRVLQKFRELKKEDL